MSNATASTRPSRYTVTAVVNFNNDEPRMHPLGAANSKRQARRLGYRTGHRHVPSRFSAAMFDLEIIDTMTGKPVPAKWAESEAIRRAAGEMTAAERGVW